jgi:Transposase IS66 family
MTDSTPARMIALMQQLYDVERATAELTAEARQAVRQEQSVPLLVRIEAERARLAQAVLPKSPRRRRGALPDQSMGCPAALRR